MAGLIAAVYLYTVASTYSSGIPDILTPASASVGMPHAPGDRYDGFAFGFRLVRSCK